MPRNLQPPKRIRDKGEAKKDAALQVLMAKSPQEGADWIEANVTSLPEAKAVLKLLAKAVIALSHRI